MQVTPVKTVNPHFGGQVIIPYAENAKGVYTYGDSGKRLYRVGTLVNDVLNLTRHFGESGVPGQYHSDKIELSFPKAVPQAFTEKLDKLGIKFIKK